jgi:hypothetical protein
MSDPSAIADCPRCRNRGPEYYEYLRHSYEFDVDAARRLVTDGRESVEVEPESVRESVRLSKIFKQHVDHVDPTFPGIIAFVWFTTDGGETYRGHLLIDGNHRAARCLREDRPYFAYLLTEDESRAILLKSPEPALAAAGA